MRAMFFLLTLPTLVPLLLAGAPASAETSKPAAMNAAAKPVASTKPQGPKAIGHFEEWTAATNTEAGQPVCYAFTRASHSAPAVAGRGDVVLTVTQRPTGRDAVAITAGFAYPTNAAVKVEVEQTVLDFYATGRSAFARDGRAAASAFGRGKQVAAHSPGPRNTAVIDTFSLKGFGHAYEAINKACPAK